MRPNIPPNAAYPSTGTGAPQTSPEICSFCERRTGKVPPHSIRGQEGPQYIGFYPARSAIRRYHPLRLDLRIAAKLLHLSFSLLAGQYRVDFPLHIFPPDRIHRVQLDAVKAAPLCKPVDQPDPVAAVLGAVAEVMVTVDKLDRTPGLFAQLDTADRRIDACAPLVPGRRLSADRPARFRTGSGSRSAASVIPSLVMSRGTRLPAYSSVKIA